MSAEKPETPESDKNLSFQRNILALIPKQYTPPPKFTLDLTPDKYFSEFKYASEFFRRLNFDYEIGIKEGRSMSFRDIIAYCRAHPKKIPPKRNLVLKFVDSIKDKYSKYFLS